MNLLFIYGPPAAGKLSVAKSLSDKLSYKLYDNHAIITPLGNLFSYTDPTLNKARSLLGERIRLDVFGTAAEVNVNLIATSARAGTKDFVFFREIREVVQRSGGNVLFVQLAPPKEVLFERIEDPSRTGIKADTKARLEEILAANPELYEKFPDEEHLTINNTDISASDTADMIIEYYSL